MNEHDTENTTPTTLYTQPPLLLAPYPFPTTHKRTLRAIRSSTSHKLLAYVCLHGILMYDRYFKTHHLLTWEQIQQHMPLALEDEDGNKEQRTA